MTKLLFNSFREVKNRLNQLSDKINEFRFGLKLISQKRYNHYFNIFMLSSTAVTTGVYLSFHCVPLSMNKWKRVVHMYDYGDLLPMNEDLQRLALNAWNDCNQTLNKSSDLVRFFPSVGSDVISVGSLGLIGAEVGIPYLFRFKTLDDIKTTELRFIGLHNPYAKWRSESGQLFLKCLVLSENAKKFAIARQIYSANNLTLFVDSLNICVSTALALGLGQVVINRSKANSLVGSAAKTIQGKIVFRTLSLVFGFYVWMQLNKIITYYMSLRADLKAVSLGDDYLNGAIEYYSKNKARNAAFNELVGENQPKLFTEEGEIRGISKYLLTFEKKINLLKNLKNRLKTQENDSKEDIN